ncbi:MAG: GtrA family protein [Chloroflexi bacterium]|nr:GtrA family protein [Chloroflexota bacterium]
MIAIFVQIAGRFGVNPKEAERFSKFLVVGTIGAVVDFGLFALLTGFVGLPTLVANTISFSAAVISNFTLNRYWTYPDSREKDIRSQLGQFALVSIIGLAINNTILGLLESPFDRLLETIRLFVGYGRFPAKIVATIVVLFWNFFVNRYWTYNDVD